MTGNWAGAAALLGALLGLVLGLPGSAPAAGYTVTIRSPVDPASFTPPAGFEAHVSALDEGGLANDVRVLRVTSADLVAFPSQGATVLPHAKVVIVVNAFIEY